MLERKKVSDLSQGVARAAYRGVGALDCAGIIVYPVDGPPDGLGIEVTAPHDCFPGVSQRADSSHDHPGTSYPCPENGIEVRYGRAYGRQCSPDLVLQPSSSFPRVSADLVRVC